MILLNIKLELLNEGDLNLCFKIEFVYRCKCIGCWLWLQPDVFTAAQILSSAVALNAGHPAKAVSIRFLIQLLTCFRVCVLLSRQFSLLRVDGVNEYMRKRP